jgi:hypothetical protein
VEVVEVVVVDLMGHEKVSQVQGVVVVLELLMNR